MQHIFLTADVKCCRVYVKIIVEGVVSCKLWLLGILFSKVSNIHIRCPLLLIYLVIVSNNEIQTFSPTPEFNCSGVNGILCIIIIIKLIEVTNWLAEITRLCFQCYSVHWTQVHLCGMSFNLLTSCCNDVTS